jgi:hypothetical protein
MARTRYMGRPNFQRCQGGYLYGALAYSVHGVNFAVTSGARGGEQMGTRAIGFQSKGQATTVRFVFVVIAVALITVAVILRVRSVQTSLVTAKSYPVPSATVSAAASATSAAPAAAVTPTVAVTPTATAAPAATATPATSASPSSETDTTTFGTASDTLELGLVGLAALFALIAVFYNRISAVTGPGGIGITLSSAQKSDASKAVARKARSRAASAVTQPEPSSGQVEPGAHLVQMAISGGADQAKALDTAEAAVQHVGEATLLTTQLAESLLAVAQKSPEEFHVTTVAWGIPPGEAAPVLAGEISPALWNRLADKALDETIPVPSPD